MSDENYLVDLWAAILDFDRCSNSHHFNKLSDVFDKVNEDYCESRHLNLKLKIALADAVRAPMGVVPDSAQGLITQKDLDEAEKRRM